MAAYRRVYDSHHLQADCKEPGSAPETYDSVIEYGLPLPFLMYYSEYVFTCCWLIARRFVLSTFYLGALCPRERFGLGAFGRGNALFLRRLV